MSSTKRWREIGGGEFLKWETPGQTVEGIWRGQHEGKFGPQGTVETVDGKKTFRLHTALLRKVQELPEGLEIQIQYTGKHMSKGGNPYHGFIVRGVDEEHVPF